MNNITVIAFYPGGGGNRYLRKIQGQEYSARGIAYDNTIKDQLFEYRYLTGTINSPYVDTILTHCMDYKKIQSVLHTNNIFVIKTDLYKSLRREWMLNGHRIFQNNYKDNNTDAPDKLKSAWATICWHLDYYQVEDMSNATLVEDPEFMNMISLELDRYHDPIFEFCWNQYQLGGPTAPIIDLYNRHIREQDFGK